MTHRKKRTRLPRVLLTLVLLLAAALVIILRNGRTPKRDIDPSRPMVALTYDDGPSANASPRILDCLEANGAVATFFEVGSNVDQYPEIVKRAAGLGCELGSHTYGHIDLPSADLEMLKEDEALCRAAFKAAANYKPRLMRPPGGAIGGEAKRYYDYPFIGWSLDTEDWRTRDAASTVAAVQSFGNLDGQVILLHSIYDATAEATEALVPWLLEQGYQLVTVSELLEYRYETKPENHLYYAVDFFRYGAEAE